MMTNPKTSLVLIGWMFLLLEAVRGFSTVNSASRQQASQRPPTTRSSQLRGSRIAEINDSNYVDILRSDRAVLIKTYAPWCGPCKLIEPIVEKCHDKYKKNLHVVSMNVETKNPNLKLELLLQKVLPRSLPSLILVSNEKAIAVHNGVITYDQLEQFLEKNLSKFSNQKLSWKDSPSSSVQKKPRRAGYVSLAGFGASHIDGADVLGHREYN